MGIFDLFSSGNEEDAMNALIDAAMNGNEEARALLEQGLAKRGKFDKRAVKAIKKSIPKYYRSGTETGYGAYLDSLGINGQEGYDRTLDRFRTSPGYEFKLESGLDAIDRRNASRGMLASGNTNLDTIQYAQGLADQEWGDYLDRLGYFGGAAQDVAHLKAQKGRDLSGANFRRGDIYTDYYDKLAGNTLDMYDKIGNAQSDYYNSKDATSANIFSALTGLLKGGIGLFA